MADKSGGQNGVVETHLVHLCFDKLKICAVLRVLVSRELLLGQRLGDYKVEDVLVLVFAEHYRDLRRRQHVFSLGEPLLTTLLNSRGV